jgi:hypothetical protein
MYRCGALDKPERGSCGRLYTREGADEVDGGIEPFEAWFHPPEAPPEERVFSVVVV